MNVVAYDIEAYPKARNAWGVQSESNPARWYTVLETRAGEWKCACPRWTRNASRPICKHIRFIQNTSAFAPVPETRPLPAAAVKFLSTFAAIEPEAGTAQKATGPDDKPSPFSLIELD